VVDEIFDTWAANKMGIDRIGQVCVMIHSGSRGLGHQVRHAARMLADARPLTHVRPAQVATDSLTAMERAMRRDNIQVNDRQLACARINSQEGQDYLARMRCDACPPSCGLCSLTCTRVTTGGHGMRCKLRVGEQELHDVPVPPGALSLLPVSASLPKFFRAPCHHGIHRPLQRCSTARPTTWTCTSSTTCRTTLLRRVSACTQIVHVSHTSTQVEEHIVDGRPRTLLVHRKARMLAPCIAWHTTALPAF
jgi:hypothetical protein